MIIAPHVKHRLTVVCGIAIVVAGALIQWPAQAQEADPASSDGVAAPTESVGDPSGDEAPTSAMMGGTGVDFVGTRSPDADDEGDQTASAEADGSKDADLSGSGSDQEDSGEHGATDNDEAGKQSEDAGERESRIEKEAKKLKPFQGAHMMVGRNVKMPTATKRFAIGIELSVSPLNVIGRLARDQFIDAAYNQVCTTTPNPDQCRESVEKAVDVLGEMSDSEWELVRGVASGDKASLMQALSDAGVTDPQVQATVAGVVDQYAGQYLEGDAYAQAVDAIRAGSSASATNMLFNAYLQMNFKWIEATVFAPFAIRNSSEGTDADMANVSVDVKAGGDWSFGKVAALAVAGGIELYMPSGTSGITDSRGTNAFYTPKFTYGMLTWAPYLVMGVELARIIQLQGHVELVSMHGVLDGAASSLEMYLKYGGGFILLPRFIVSIIFELNGITGLKNSTWDEVLTVGAGINISFKIFKIFLGVNMPLLDQGKYVWQPGYWSGANYDQLSKFGVTSRIGFEF